METEIQANRSLKIPPSHHHQAKPLGAGELLTSSLGCVCILNSSEAAASLIIPSALENPARFETPQRKTGKLPNSGD